MTHQRGMIAILDALGAATYSESEIDRFLESRELVLNRLNKKALGGALDKSRLRIFTFNDTVVIVYLAKDNRDITLEDIEEFAIRLRAFMMHSLQTNILFRGSLSVGDFRSIDDNTNTVLGAAVSDAAAWYDKADWIGIAATPHASIFIQSLAEQNPKGLDGLDYILVDYDVPLKTGKTIKLKAINWPKAFYIRGLRPPLLGNARSMLLRFLSRNRIPLGVEAKYIHTLAFFDRIKACQDLGNPDRPGSKLVPDPPAPTKSPKTKEPLS